MRSRVLAESLVSLLTVCLACCETGAMQLQKPDDFLPQVIADQEVHDLNDCLTALRDGRIPGIVITDDLRAKITAGMKEGADILSRPGTSDNLAQSLKETSRTIQSTEVFRLRARNLIEWIARANGVRHWRELLCLSAVANPPPAGMPTGELIGRVTGEDSGFPLEGVYLELRSLCGGYWTYGYTNASGYYSLESLEPGLYRLKIDAAGTALNYVSEYYDHAQTYYDCKPVNIMDGYTQTLNIALRPGGIISGMFTDPLFHPAANVSIYAIQVDGSYQSWTLSEVLGAFHLRGLDPGTYVVYAEDFQAPYDYPFIVYPDRCSIHQGQQISVLANTEINGIDFHVQPGQYIFGYVLDAESETPMGGVTVSLFNGDYFLELLESETEPDGRYVLSPVAPGTYKLVFQMDGYIQQFYDGTTDYFAADDIEVSPGSTMTGPFNVTIHRGATVSGAITDAVTGLPIAGAFVRVTDEFDESFQTASSEADGHYIVNGLASGRYFIEIIEYDYFTEYYHQKSDFFEADPVTITAPDTLSGMDFRLYPRAYGRISGQVTDTYGMPISTCSVYAVDARLNTSSSAQTDCNGSFTLERLETGGYYVVISSGFNYTTVYYPDAAHYDDALLVQVISPSTTENINFQTSPGARIKGNAYETGTGHFISPIVLCYDTQWNLAGASQGLTSYALRGLRAGSYYLLSLDLVTMGHTRSYYQNHPAPELAELITISGTEQRTGIDFFHHPAAMVSGRIYMDYNSSELSRPAIISVRDGTALEIENTSIGRFGAYSVLIEADSNQYLHVESPFIIDEYYGESATIAGADPLALSPGDYLTGQNIHVSPNPVWLELAPSPVIAGDSFDVDLFLENHSTGRPIDLYIGLMAGSVFYFLELTGSGAWTLTTIPSALSFTMPAEFSTGAIPLFHLTLPAGSALPYLPVDWYAVALDSATQQLFGDLYTEQMVFRPS